MASEKRLIDADALCEFFQERYEYLRNASEEQLPNGLVRVDTEIQVGAIIAKEFLDKAKQAPTVDAVPVVHGRWIDTDYKPDIYCKCSVCGRRVYAYDDGYNYCPNCGARMDGDGNG